MAEDPTAGRKKKGKDWWVVDEDVDKSLFRYRKLWAGTVISTCIVSLVPLVVMAVINYYQYQKAFSEEVKHPLHLLASNARRSLQFFLHERVSVLNFIIHDKSYAELSDQKHLAAVFNHLREAQIGFVDLGVVDADGTQRFYVGPYGLRDKSYKKQPWFEETMLQGQSVSDVFLGYRKFPHFAIAVRGLDEDGKAYVLRATLNADMLARVREADAARASRDTFIINRDGVLQTASKRFGAILEKVPIPVPPATDHTHVREERDPGGGARFVGFATITDSPFLFMAIEQRDTLLASWFTLRNKLLVFLGASMLVIVIVILAGASYSVNRIREADDKRLGVLHKVEYTAKMASIGRLAAGVAHEINNPLAIINEKAGLLKDVLGIPGTGEFPHRDKFLKNVDQILGSVDRCARITRRLLSFAKHMDVRCEPIDLTLLMREVLGFLEKEAHHRNLKIAVDTQPDVPLIDSDRGRLQQVFLNIVNNAFSAVADGGRIDIYISREGDRHVSVTIRDNGEGIPEEHLSKIFEPFFTTKEKHGTGLGLSITYGIVEKLGGKITVDSAYGEWTKFSVILPIEPETIGAQNGD